MSSIEQAIAITFQSRMIEPLRAHCLTLTLQNSVYIISVCLVVFAPVD